MKKAIILGMIMTCLLLSTAGFADSWWDGDWQYRRIITVDNTGNSNTLTDYQIAINVTYDSDMQSDFDDIKFIDSDDSTELNYWLQEKVDPEWAYFWVKIPSIPASSTKIIYMYYGNPSASSESDIQKTMIIGDDFDDNNFNTTKWSTDANSGATEESNGILNVSCGFNVDSKRRHYTLEKNITTGILEGRVKIDDIENTVGHQYHALALSNVVEWWVDVDLASVDFNEGSEAENYVRCTTRNEGNYTDNHNPQDFVENNWVKFKIVLKSNEFATYYKNETLMHNHTTNVPDEPLFVLLTSETGQLSGTSSDFWTAYDWVFVRKYASLEPTYSVGTEESIIPPESECNCINKVFTNKTTYPPTLKFSLDCESDAVIHFTFIRYNTNGGNWLNISLDGQILAKAYMDSSGPFNMHTTAMNLMEGEHLVEVNGIENIPWEFNELTVMSYPKNNCMTNCTELTEKVSELNSTVEDLKDRVETLEDNQGNVPSHTHLISDIIGLQSILDSIQNSLNKLIGLLTYLPRGLRQDMICDYMKAKSMTSLDALGLHCDIIKKNCKCKAIV